MMLSTFLILATLSLASAFCHHGTTLWKRAGNTPNFGYEGNMGALGWAALNDTYDGCATGKQQSPVNLVEGGGISRVRGAAVNLNMPDLSDGAQLENLGSTLEVMMQNSGAAITFRNRRATLVQYHFHNPSEHHVNGEHFSMEVHFVFEINNRLIVLGIPIEISATSDSFLGSTFANLAGAAQSGNSSTTGPLSFGPLVNHVRRSRVWTYRGSLTTPPCSEVVTWLFVENSINVGFDLYKDLKRTMKFNARFTQNAPGSINLLEFVHDTFVRKQASSGNSAV